jgi:Glycosyl transferases group 1
VWSSANPWSATPDRVVPAEEPIDADVLFLSGVDWTMIDRTWWPEAPVPVINLIQHLWHADPRDRLGRARFLPNKAIRICVSPEVTRAIGRTGRARGPVFTIPDAVDLRHLTSHARNGPRDLDLLVLANKQPGMGHAVLEQLSDVAGRAQIVDSRSPHGEVLDLLARAAVTVFVPNPKEGFYLPALEGMALGTIVVCPDCVGNRSYCLDGVTAFRPPYGVEEIAASARDALARRTELTGMIDAAAETARGHDLRHERSAFLDILDRLDELWATA